MLIKLKCEKGMQFKIWEEFRDLNKMMIQISKMHRTQLPLILNLIVTSPIIAKQLRKTQ